METSENLTGFVFVVCFFFNFHLDGEEPEYLRADAGHDMVAYSERAVSVRLPELYELLSKLFVHLTKRRNQNRTKAAEQDPRRAMQCRYVNKNVRKQHTEEATLSLALLMA